MFTKTKRKNDPLLNLAELVPFTDADLAANRRGELTPAQVYRLRKRHQNWSWFVLIGVLLVGGACYGLIYLVTAENHNALRAQRNLPSLFFMLSVLLICLFTALYLYRQTYKNLRVRRYEGILNGFENVYSLDLPHKYSQQLGVDMFGDYSVRAELRHLVGQYVIVYLCEPSPTLLSLELPPSDEPEPVGEPPPQ